MSVDAWMPQWDIRSQHHVEIRADPPAVYQALLATDFGRNPVLRILMGFRLLPALVFSPRRTWRQLREVSRTPREVPHGRLLSGAFAQLEARPPDQLTLGLTGRFWTPTGGLVPTDPQTFREQLPPGLARATWSFELQSIGAGRTRLTTETRVSCADPATRRRFLWYWRLVRGGSGMIRWALLRQVKLAAERATG